MVASLIKWNKGGLKNPMARARGLGAAHDGVHHWIGQRISAVLLLPLIAWLCWSLVDLVHADHAAFVAWLSKPWNAILMLLTILTMIYHAAVGSQVIIEDYIHGEAFKIVKLVAMKITMWVLAIACIYAVLKVAI